MIIETLRRLKWPSNLDLQDQVSGHETALVLIFERLKGACRSTRLSIVARRRYFEARMGKCLQSWMTVRDGASVPLPISTFKPLVLFGKQESTQQHVNTKTSRIFLPQVIEARLPDSWARKSRSTSMSTSSRLSTPGPEARRSSRQGSVSCCLPCNSS